MKKSIKSLVLAASAIIMMALQTNSQVTLNLKIFLEGPFNGTSMNTNLNVQNLIPLNQPYSTDPWNYTGTELVSAIPNSTVVDWVLIELRETTGDASTATPDKQVFRKAAFLLSDGRVVSTDGVSKPVWPGTVSGNLYVIIRHRNHLAVMSSGPLVYAAGMYSWYFTTQLSKAYLNGQKQIGTNVFGMTGGDCDGSGRTIQKDKILTWEDHAGFYGYFASDLNLDGQVDNTDKDWVYIPNIGQSAQLPEGTAWECGMDITDLRDGQVYSTVQINDQCWMAENLNYGIMVVTPTPMTDNGVFEKYCYNNVTDSCDKYGGLYQWDELMNYSSMEGAQGLCPDGWHLATDAEWCALSEFVDPSVVCQQLEYTGTDIGTKLKSNAGWLVNGNGTDIFGFNALATGTQAGGDPYAFGAVTHFWTSTLTDASNTYFWKLEAWEPRIYRYGDNFTRGASARCIKNPEPQTWSCGDPLIDSRDNQSYNTVQIGEQCWMAENLDIGHMIEPQQAQSDNSIIEKYCYNGTQDSCDVYGGLYQWNEMMQYDTIAGRRGICPTGWHLPTDEEWKELEGAADSQYGYPDPEWNTTGFRGFDAGKNLKSQEQWLLEGNGIDLFGFNVLPGGNVSNEGLYDNLGAWADFWTSNNMNESGISRDFSHNSLESWRDNVQATYAFSVRCIKNSEPLPWSCGDPLIDTRDNQSYNTVQIGEQCWMAENMNIGTMINGIADQANNSIIEKYCYDNDPSKCDEYGGLYQWNEMMLYSTTEGSVGICPVGWHLPSEGEWCELNHQMDPTVDCNASGWFTGTDIGVKMKSDHSWNYGGNGSNESGFTALGIGNRDYAGNFIDLGNNSHFWTSLQSLPGISNVWVLDYSNTGIFHSGISQNFGFGVRCIKDPEEQPWYCGDPLLDSRDNQSYNTVQIGDQCWMAENLNTGTLIQSTNAPDDNNIIEKFCFNDNLVNCEEYGALYSWSEMMAYNSAAGSQGICPQGFHVPMDEEWITLSDYLGGNSVAGGKMKETGFLHWMEPNTGATNESGFNAIGSGFLNPYVLLNYSSYMWSSTIAQPMKAYYRYLMFDSPVLFRASVHGMSSGFSLRCLKDTESQSWSCGDPLLDNRDYQQYNTVQIGDQCWMAENLNIGNRVSPYGQTNNGIIEKLCYGEISANCDQYGGLYEWNEMMNYSTNQNNQGICPEGWRVPKLSEWESLINYLGGASVAGGKLKETGFTHWETPNTDATNETGFTAFGSGKFEDGYGLLNQYGNFWTSFFNGEDHFMKYVRYNSGAIESGYSYFEYRNANSVRCIKPE